MPETPSKTGGANLEKNKEYHILTKIPMVLSVPLLGRTQLSSPFRNEPAGLPTFTRDSVVEKSKNLFCVTVVDALTI